MLVLTNEQITVAFTAPQLCANCGNTNPFIVATINFKQKLIIIPLTDQINGANLICPTCENKKTYSFGSFSSSAKRAELQKFISDGRDYTLSFYRKSDEKRRNYILRSLQKIGSVDVIQYLTK